MLVTISIVEVLGWCWTGFGIIYGKHKNIIFMAIPRRQRSTFLEKR